MSEDMVGSAAEARDRRRASLAQRRQADAWTRIATALERIADHLDSRGDTSDDGSSLVTTWYRCRLHPTNVQATTDGLEPDPCHRYDEIKDAPCFLPMETFVPPGPISTE